MTNYDEQRTRTIAGWIGVEISRSRVRTPGKPGYGLYRVRGSMPVQWSIRHGKTEIDRSPGQSEPTLWTAYAFTLSIIAAAVRNSIDQGRPEGPMMLHLVEAGDAVKTGEGGYAAMHKVPTRWTSAYQGRRDLGVQAEPISASIKPGVADPVTGELVPDIESVISEAGERRITASVRRRALNRTAAREFAERRKHGLVRRHAAKSARLGLS